MKLTGPGRIGFLQSIFPDARFINVVRNPATMVNSFINVDFWRDSGMDKLWWTGGYNGEELKEFERIRHDPIAATAFQLAKVVKTTEEEAEAVGAEMLTIDYDDFLNNPRLGVSAMLQHARLDDSDRVWDKLASLKLHGGSGRHRDLSDEQYETVMSMFANSAGYA